METFSFTAATAAEALEQIRLNLGPEAVVLNVRPLPANGISRLWQKPMIEVLAYKPEAPAPEVAPASEAVSEVIQQLREAKQATGIRMQQRARAPEVYENHTPAMPVPPDDGVVDSGNWRVGAILQKTGFLPLNAQRVVDQLRNQCGERPPASLGEEIGLMRSVLENLWRRPRPLASNSTHVLVGPAGSGKTTCLCKWLTQAALMEGRLARVWRLDGATANMAEALSVYCEILGVPSERSWQNGAEVLAEDIGFIDLPGIDWRQPMAIKELSGQLKQLDSPRVHLVLNGAYEIPVLMDQVRAFSCLPVEDLIITHLDEETRWGKLWNLVLGTNYSIRHLSAGQNIPGDFCEASAEKVLSRQFPRK